ncbi:MAG: M16 family metallopeptidase [Bacteroidia bacterium]
MKRIFLTIFSVVLGISATQAQLDRSKRPEPAPAPAINLGEAQSFTLDNGLKVFVVENHKLPRVAFSLQLDIEPVLEGAVSGCADLTGSLMSAGTTSRSKEQLDEEIDFIGASLNTSASGLFATSLKKHLPKLSELISDVVLNPAFDAKELEKLRKQTLDGLMNAKDNPEAISDKVSNIILYGKNHPYGEPQTEESVAKVTLDDCKKYYKTYFRPNVAYLAIVGDITPAEAKEVATKMLGNWSKAEVPAPKYALPKEPAKTGVSLVNRSASVQSIVNITYPINLKPGESDVIVSRVLNNVLGGGASGRLFQNLREKHSYTYGAYSSMDEDELIGNFNAGASVRNAVTDSSVAEIMSEMRRIKDTEISDEDLKSTISFLSGGFARGLENPQTIARFAINTDKYKLPKDYYATYLQKLAAITKDDVKKAAAKYIRPENAHIIVVGSKAEVGEKLKRFGEVTLYDAEGNAQKEADNKPMPKVTGDDIVNNYIKAIGGVKNLAKVKDVTIIRNASLDMGPQSLDLTMTTIRKVPNMILNKVESEMFNQYSLFDGTKGFTKSSMAGLKEVTGEELEDMKADAGMFPELEWKAKGYKLTVLGTETINGKEAYALSVETPKGGKSTQYFAVDSGLRLQEVETKKTPQGEMAVTTNFDDYREVNKVKFPYTVEQNAGPQKLKFVASSVKVNTKVKNTVFVLK